ncbi:hypothetical protein H6F44_12660 [Pseudanabaena sp. FACHB-1277]|uniref:Uncharacterized protein n=1 Tax=Pseudanabaena cinerea FACHB-1277 TaxID=2949581 RepID=A0A926Z6N6_9CYAN|nr:hypothetical protein [Pseudanabaena cinerea]MBD2150963.1 hypothetical protein [Pseudanabaena cinerea FACHB-1277]
MDIKICVMQGDPLLARGCDRLETIPIQCSGQTAQDPLLARGRDQLETA